ncbi:MAG: FMN reductase [Actinobacteria bacterium]|uniref:Unannotated protein n=1 Tax=freshwater metagenome TaxID=449393 RepID=A0A6J7SF79_9ZZZZ|nr:FMN reductase [Actinomycetota bacterium]MTB27948.1 FMN reductase [Actinomycetota bacterium]
MLIVGIGGTTNQSSSSDAALRLALDEVESQGAQALMVSGDLLKNLPMYDPVNPERTPEALELIAAMREASGIIISAASYHGSISGMLKNALDYAEDLALDERAYFSGMPVGSIAVAKGYQAAVNTLATLRIIVHSLRGWPTPYGCIVNTSSTEQGTGIAGAQEGLRLVASEVVHLARAFETHATIVASQS